MNKHYFLGYAPMHQVGYREEILQTRVIENMKQKQESHEKLPHTKIETNENDIINLSAKMIYLKKRMLHCETDLEQF